MSLPLEGFILPLKAGNRKKKSQASDDPFSGMSSLERKFALLWDTNYPEIDLHIEHRFAPPRRFRFDFAHLPSKTAIEIQGGSWNAGGHVRGAHFDSDCEKLNLAASQGWAVFKFTATMLRDDRMAGWLDLLAQTIQQREEA